jgi:voltage-gated potassium channel
VKRWLQRFRANLYYVRRPLRDFCPSLLAMALLLILGGVSFHLLYEKESLTFLRALYITYCLLFMEHLIEFPDHWLLQVFYFLLPPFGLVVILDGIARFGYHLLGREGSGFEWVRAMAKTYRDHVVLCGLGRVGLRILEQLIQLGEDVIVLERKSDNANIAFAKKHGVPVLVGSGREEGIMENLNVAKAKSIILATDDDLANLEMAMDARQVNPSICVVLRMFDQELASKVRESFDIDLAFSTAAQAAPLFATSSSDRSIINSFYVGDQLLVVAKLRVSPDSELAGKRIREFGPEHRIFVLSQTRREQETHFPPGENELRPGDELVIQTVPATLKRLHQWNRANPA